MNNFTIYKHPNGLTEAVKQGWSWPAFFFTIFWCFAKKITKLGSIIIGIWFGVWIIMIILNELGEYVLSAMFNFIPTFGIPIWLGKNGNEERQENLMSRGYELKATVLALNSDGAIAQYLKDEQE